MTVRRSHVLLQLTLKAENKKMYPAGNTLVIYMVVRNRRMRTITNFFIANLAFSDVVIGVFSIPFQFQVI